MKVKYNDEDVFELTEIQEKVIKNDIDEDIFDDDMKRRIQYIVEHKYQQCYKRLLDEWMPKLKERFESIPTKESDLAQLIFNQPDYENRKRRNQKQRDFEELERNKNRQPD